MKPAKWSTEHNLLLNHYADTCDNLSEMYWMIEQLARYVDGETIGKLFAKELEEARHETHAST